MMSAHRSLGFAVLLTFTDRVALVVLMLTTGQCQLDLGATTQEIDLKRNQGQPLFGDPRIEAIDLPTTAESRPRWYPRSHNQTEPADSSPQPASPPDRRPSPPSSSPARSSPSPYRNRSPQSPMITRPTAQPRRAPTLVSFSSDGEGGAARRGFRESERERSASANKQAKSRCGSNTERKTGTRDAKTAAPEGRAIRENHAVPCRSRRQSTNPKSARP